MIMLTKEVSKVKFNDLVPIAYIVYFEPGVRRCRKAQ